MIKFEGIEPKDRYNSILKFSNETGKVVEIPLEKAIVARISMYLNMISTTPIQIVERNNENDSEEV